MVNNFRGEYSFLSNFYFASVHMDGMLYSTVEHAFQAAKTLCPKERKEIALAKTPAIAKKLGKGVTLRPDWNDCRLEIMEKLIEEKFKHPHLKRKLLETGETTLVEGNYWGDVFWGVCRGEGENHLGKILMRVREKLQKENP